MLIPNFKLHLTLPKLLFLGSVKFLFLSLVNAYPAVAQSINYSCGSYQQGYATFSRGSLGVSPIIFWNNRQPVCNTVSARFQTARDNGNLRFVMREDNLVCGTNRHGGECLNLLFATDTVGNAQFLWERLRNNNAIEGRFITESSGRDYFNLELYLETVPPSEQIPLLIEDTTISSN